LTRRTSTITSGAGIMDPKGVSRSSVRWPLLDRSPESASRPRSPTFTQGSQGVLRVVVVVQMEADETRMRVIEDVLVCKKSWEEIAKQEGCRLQPGMSPIVAVLGMGFTQEESAYLSSAGIYVFDRSADPSGKFDTYETLLDHFAKVLDEGVSDDWLSVPPPSASEREPVFDARLPENERMALIECLSRSWEAL
jgi:hypothetical protein